MGDATSHETSLPEERSALARALWVAAGLVCVAVGGVGIVVPGLPSTVFFIGATACFTRSSPRLEAWVLGLPGVGTAVRDFREGRGMPRKAKVAASASITVFGGGAAVFAFTEPLPRTGMILFALAGIIAVWRVEERE